MLYRAYDSYGYDTSERFVSTAVQKNFEYDGEKKGKEQIKYTEQESFISEKGPKEEELITPTNICGKKETSKENEDKEDKE